MVGHCELKKCRRHDVVVNRVRPTGVPGTNQNINESRSDDVVGNALKCLKDIPINSRGHGGDATMPTVTHSNKLCLKDIPLAPQRGRYDIIYYLDNIVPPALRFRMINPAFLRFTQSCGVNNNIVAQRLLFYLIPEITIGPL